jgi:ribonuclease HII
MNDFNLASTTSRKTIMQSRRFQEPPSFAEEHALLAQGYSFVAGIDEVGRGALAGPVAAAAVILPPNLDAPWLSLVRDSKQLNAKQRQFLTQHIREASLAVGVGMVSHQYIDSKGIIWSTRQAMRLAMSELEPAPDFLLIDGLALPAIKLPQKHIIKGDCICFSISCASIVAKVARDQLMADLSQEHPGYGFAAHKGYGTAEHLDALRRLGVCPIHRRSFAPVKELCP